MSGSRVFCAMFSCAALCFAHGVTAAAKKPVTDLVRPHARLSALLTAQSHGRAVSAIVRPKARQQQLSIKPLQTKQAMPLHSQMSVSHKAGRTARSVPLDGKLLHRK